MCFNFTREFTLLFLYHDISQSIVHVVPDCECASNTIIEASSLLILVDKCDKAAICNNSSKITSNSSDVRSGDLLLKNKRKII